MTAPLLDGSPAGSGRFSGLVRRYAGLLAASGIALVWTTLALRRPDATYHFAPIVVASVWGAARRWVAAGPSDRAAGLAAAAGGGMVALVTTAVLAWSGALEGPTVWGTTGALGETLAFAAAGAALAYRFVTRRRPGILFEA